MLKISIQKEASQDIVFFEGPIDENCGEALNGLHGQVGNKVVLNFRKLEYVNSLGIRNWINFLINFEEGRDVTFDDCPSDVIMQINMVPKFVGSCKVKSFFGNFSCESCGHEMEVNFSADESQDDLIEKSSNIQCEKCQAIMEFEEDADSYFEFLAG